MHAVNPPEEKVEKEKEPEEEVVVKETESVPKVREMGGGMVGRGGGGRGLGRVVIIYIFLSRFPSLRERK